jgi:hypothetical protein
MINKLQGREMVSSVAIAKKVNEIIDIMNNAKEIQQVKE